MTSLIGGVSPAYCDSLVCGVFFLDSNFNNEERNYISPLVGIWGVGWLVVVVVSELVALPTMFFLPSQG